MEFHIKPKTFVEHIHVKVEDLERSLRFYQGILGLKILQQTEKTRVLSADGKKPLITIEVPEAVVKKQPRTTGLYHFALLLPKRADLAKTLRHLAASNVRLQGASDHAVSEAIYLADPDGNGIEIYSDRPASAWEWNNQEVVMATKPLDVQGLMAEDDGQSWSGLPEGTLMGHIHLHVDNIEKSREFYCDGLGFDVVSRIADHAMFISTGGYHHHIAFNVWNGTGAQPPVENSVGMRFYTIVYPSEAARSEAVQRLTALGYTVNHRDQAIAVTDPAGNQIELVA